jgi:hypothetical protein
MAKQQNTRKASTKSTSKKSVKTTSTKEAKVQKLTKEQKAQVKEMVFTSQARSIVQDAVKSAKATISLAKTTAQTFTLVTKTAKGNEAMFNSMWKKFTSTVKLMAGALSDEDANNLSSQISQLKRLMEWKPIYISRFSAGNYGKKFTLAVGKKRIAAKGSLSDTKLLNAKRYTFDKVRIAKMVVGMCKGRRGYVRQVVDELNTISRTL